MKIFAIILICICFMNINAQEMKQQDLLYYEIPEHPDAYTDATVAARMIDGLGFRYYWATEALRREDLTYKPSETGRESLEIIKHIYGLSKTIRNSVLETDKDENKSELDYEAMRRQTLYNFKIVSDTLRNTEIPFNLNKTSMPFWNIINGPIADAIWHCGQVVLLRRASGNPFNSKVNLFTGKLKD